MVNHQDLYDPYIKEAVKHELESVPVPNMEDVWLNIEESLAKKHKKNNSFLYKKLAIGFAALLVLSIGFIQNDDYAYYKRAFNYLVEVLENTVAMQIDIRKEGNNQDIIKVISLSLEDAISRSDFDIKTPELLPEGYSLAEVQLEELNDRTLRVVLEYNAEGAEDSITIIQEPLQGEVEKPQGIISEETLDGDAKYTIYGFNDKYFSIHWEKADLRFIAKGMDKEELIGLVMSIK